MSRGAQSRLDYLARACSSPDRAFGSGPKGSRFDSCQAHHPELQLARGHETADLTLDDAAKIALALPDVTEASRFGNRTWFVAGKGFAWERPLNKADLRRLGAEPPPEGPLLAVRVSNMDDKEVLMLDPPEGFFDIEHFRGYPAVLIKLRTVKRGVLKDAMTEAWRVCAKTPKGRRRS